jgi:hypothetical protein
MKRYITTLLGLLLVTTSVQANTIQLTNLTPADPYGVGDNFFVDIVGTDFTSALDGGGLDVSFDATVINYVGISFDPMWNLLTGVGSVDNTSSTGLVDDIEFNQLAFPPATLADFTIATLEFTTIDVGSSFISLALGSNPFAYDAAIVPVTLGDDINVDVTAVVPEPSTWMLMLLALLGVLAVSRKDGRMLNL